jgi:hypothetical protein
MEAMHGWASTKGIVSGKFYPLVAIFVNILLFFLWTFDVDQRVVEQYRGHFPKHFSVSPQLLAFPPYLFDFKLILLLIGNG